MNKFLKNRLTVSQANSIIKERLERRESLFLRIVEKAIYGNPRSPYLKLLDSCGYKLQGIKDLVLAKGIEATLEKLAQEGVYISFEEFKGRKKVVRKKVEFTCCESDFDNPYLSGDFSVQSGGTKSPGTRTMIDFDFLEQEAANRLIALDIYGVLNSPCVLWYPILPGNAGIQNIFRQEKAGCPVVKWFSQIDHRSIKPSIQNRLGTGFIVKAGNFFGSKIPKPEYVDLSRADLIAKYLARLLKEHGKCSIFTYVNSSIRICLAAKEAKLDLKGAHFFISGEPLTQTKFEEITSVKARAIPYFAFVEGGIAAYGCSDPRISDDMHVLSDRIALVTHKRSALNTNEIVDSLLFTSILPESPKILLNVETGDSGELAHRDCGCPFGQLGFSQHLSKVRSFEKLTSEGMTFMVGEFVRIAEELLPKRFGGSSTDYQIEENLNNGALSSVNISVSPRVGKIDENDLVNTVIEELGKGEDYRRMMASVWKQAGTIRVKRMEPVPTKRGKILSFRTESN